MLKDGTIRWGLAGYGDLSRNRLVKALNGIDRRLEIVWGRRAVKAKLFAEELGIPQATDDIKTLINNVDSVYIATPVSSHVPILQLALSKNLPVIVEKPLSPLIHPTHHLLQIAREKQIQVAVAYYRRLVPAARYLKDLLTSRKLGQLRQVTVEFRTFFLPSSNDPKRWRCDPAVAGAGVIADAGSHRLDLLCWFFGRPHKVKAFLGEPFAEGCERVAQLKLIWSNHLEATCYFSWNSNQNEDFMQFDFERGQLRWDPLDTGHLRFQGLQEMWEKKLPPPTNPHEVLVSAFGDRLPTCSLAEAALVDRIIESAIESSKSNGSWINLSEVRTSNLNQFHDRS